MNLFYTRDNGVISDIFLVEQLKKLGANECKTIFVHSDIMFGTMNPELNRQAFMKILLEIFDKLEVENIIFPTFSYSFANNKDFDVKNSRSLMGSLSEAFRKQDNVYRTLDPLTSFAIKGNLANKFKDFKPINMSFGKNTFFDLLDKEKNVKYLFFGADFAKSFTYLHHVEKILNVEYRFDMEFSGTITDYNDIKSNIKWSINTQCGGIKLREDTYFKDELIKFGKLKFLKCAEKELSCISQDVAKDEIIKRLEKNKFYFLKEPYEAKDLTKIYSMKPDDSGYITHC